MTEPGESTLRAAHLRGLKWGLQSLARSGSDQRALFPDYVVNPDDLALDFDHWAFVVRSNDEIQLSTSQAEALTAIDAQLAVMSRDSTEFDLELWTEAALRTSEYWAEIRRLATSALEAFAWPIETPPEDPERQKLHTTGATE